MCEFIDKNTNPDGGFKASEDIVCYKVLKTIENSYRSTIYDHVWVVGQTYNTVLTVRKDFYVYECIRYFDISHNWSKAHVSQYEMIEYPGIMCRLTDLLETQCGFYSYARYMNERMIDAIQGYYKGYERFNNIKIVVGRFVIPKGSRYYVNDDASVYISNALRFDGIVGEYTEN